jgi:hypothetical protein
MSNPTPPAQKHRAPTIMPGSNPDIDKFMGLIPPDNLAAPLPPIIKKSETVPLPDEPIVSQESTVKPEEVVTKTPHEEYLDALKAIDVTPDQAANIVDSLIIHGFYEETFLLNKKFPVKFRTRDQSSNLRVDKALADQKPEYNSSYMTLVVTHNIAASLVQWGKFICKPYESDEEFEKTLKLVQKIPQPIFQLLVEQLSKFDQKLLTVSNSAAVISNF